MRCQPAPCLALGTRPAAVRGGHEGHELWPPTGCGGRLQHGGELPSCHLQQQSRFRHGILPLIMLMAGRACRPVRAHCGRSLSRHWKVVSRKLRGGGRLRPCSSPPPLFFAHAFAHHYRRCNIDNHNIFEERRGMNMCPFDLRTFLPAVGRSTPKNAIGHGC